MYKQSGVCSGLEARLRGAHLRTTAVILIRKKCAVLFPYMEFLPEDGCSVSTQLWFTESKALNTASSTSRVSAI